MKIIEKRWENEGGDILVRQTDNCGIVEIMHLYSENKSGCVIGYWEVRDVDGEPMAEFSAVHDRFANTKYSFDIMEAVRWGEKLASLLV